MEASKLQVLKDRLFELETTMVNSFAEQKNRNREMFLISEQIEKIENPKAYKENAAHREGHELRF